MRVRLGSEYRPRNRYGVTALAFLRIAHRGTAQGGTCEAMLWIGYPRRGAFECHQNSTSRDPVAESGDKCRIEGVTAVVPIRKNQEVVICQRLGIQLPTKDGCEVDLVQPLEAKPEITEGADDLLTLIRDATEGQV